MLRRSYKVKLYPNAVKAARLDALLVEWQRLVKDKLQAFWGMGEMEKHPPLEFRLGSSLIRRTTDEAWRIVRTAKKIKQVNCPEYKAQHLEFGEDTANLNFGTAGYFDGWIEVQGLTSPRIKLPFKSYRLLNEVLETGTFSNGLKLVKEKSGWFALLCVKSAPVETKNPKRIGIDVGVNLAAMTSTNHFYGAELKALRTHTKHRKYRCVSKMPYRQGLNHVVRQIISDNPATDFSVEQLHFTGKRKRTKLFRSRLQNFAYGHLANRLEQLGDLKCFQVHRVNPACTSQTCPQCGHVEKQNRSGERFACLQCGYTAHADLVGALNINGGKPVFMFGDLVQAGSFEKDTGRVSKAHQNLAAKETINASPGLIVAGSE